MKETLHWLYCEDFLKDGGTFARASTDWGEYEKCELCESLDLIYSAEDCVEVEDGCVVEPDGQCPHGYKSPLILMGFI